MIRYSLVCAKGHSFESWFQSSAVYDRQARRGQLECPVCGDTKVEKALMAPKLSGTRKRSVPHLPPVATDVPLPSADTATPVAMMSPQEQEFRAKLKELRDHITRNADNVGERFPDEARKMHYGEIEHRSIYGKASPEEAQDMHEEGIEFHPLPVLPDEAN